MNKLIKMNLHTLVLCVLHEQGEQDEQWTVERTNRVNNAFEWYYVQHVLHEQPVHLHEQMNNMIRWSPPSSDIVHDIFADGLATYVEIISIWTFCWTW